MAGKIKKIFFAFLIFNVNLSAQNHVIITAGQSNTDGRVSNKLLPGYIKALATDTADFKDGTYRFCKISQNRRDGKFIPYFPKGRITDGLWTYDAVTYYLFEQALQEDFYVVKHAVGGTSIQYPNDSAKGRYWSANADWLAKTVSVEKGGKSLLLSFTDGIDAAIDSVLSKLEGGYQIDAFLWHQGESDDRYAEKYYENLKAVVAYVRMHLTEKTGKDYSRLPFIFGSIPHTNRHYRERIEWAMQRLADEDPNAYLVDMSAGELQRDRTHFNEKAAEYLGKEMFRILDKICNYSKLPFRIARYKDDKQCAISYTFDDGLQEHATLVAPFFDRLGFKATFWVNGKSISDTAAAGEKPRMTWAQLKKMAKNGHEISNHGWSHKNLTKLAGEALRSEIQKNDTLIFENTGGKSTAENLERRVENLLAAGDWDVTMTHGITYGYDHFRNAGVFWEHLQKVKAQEDRIWVGTFALTGVIEQEHIKKIIVRQGKERLKVRILPDKALFDFDPFGGEIEIKFIKQRDVLPSK
jgi:peptidoglycan/xylan/chitin deacetylase (PgdA/CDA1 family)